MKLFANKKLIQKITIVMVFLILFNFIIPNYSNAGFVDVIAEGAETIGEALAPIINVFIRFLGDSALTVIQKMFIGTDPFYDDKIDIQISPGKIFSGVIYVLDIDFLSAKSTNSTTTNTDTDNDNTQNINISNEKWYKEYSNAMETFNKKRDSYTKSPDTAKYHAYTLLQYSIYATNAETASKKIDDLYNKMTSYDKDKLYDAVKEYSNYNYNNYFDGKVTESEMDEEAKDLLNDIKFFDAVKEYVKYKSDNDPALFYASKPENAPAYILHDIISTWYRILRNIALIFLLAVLVYIGIRIMLSSTAADNTKYKKMLMDWVVAVCILFALHYIMAFAINVTQLITDAFKGSNVTVTSADQIMTTVRENAKNNNSSGLGYTLLYLVLIFYTIYFLFYYIKRVVYIAFLTLIAPLVSLTYPLDKIGDSKAQAFNLWLKEYMLNVLAQPIHLLIYTTMVTSALALAENNPIYAIVVMGAMIPAEKFIKEMFGLESQKGPKGGLLAGAATMTMMQRLAGRKPPQFGHQSGGSEKDTSSNEKSETNKKPRMDGEKNAELSKNVTGDENNDNSSVKTANTNNSTEDKPDIDDGDYQDSRSQQNNDIEEQESSSEEDMNSLSEPQQYDGPEMPEIQSEEDNELENEDIRTEQIDNETSIPQEESQTILSDDSNASIRIGTGAPSATSDKPEKKRNIKRAARAATAKHYAGKVFNRKNLRKLGRRALKTGVGLVGAGVAGTVGLAAGIASGDASKAAQYAGLGAMAGSKFGANVGDGIANFAGGAWDLGTGISSTYKEQYNELSKYDKNAQREQMEKENKKYAYKRFNSEAKAAIKERYGNNISKEDMKATQAAIERYRNNGVEDLDTIFNSYNLEQGKDAYGNDIGEKLSQEHAMYIAQMASKMDPNNASSRKALENSMQMQFAQNFEEGGMERAAAIEKGKELRKKEMQYVDMVQGKTREEARSIAKQAEINKTYEDSKDEKAARMQAQFNAEEQRKKS